MMLSEVLLCIISVTISIFAILISWFILKENNISRNLQAFNHIVDRLFYLEGETEELKTKKKKEKFETWRMQLLNHLEYFAHLVNIDYIDEQLKIYLLKPSIKIYDTYVKNEERKDFDGMEKLKLNHSISKNKKEFFIKDIFKLFKKTILIIIQLLGYAFLGALIGLIVFVAFYNYLDVRFRYDILAQEPNFSVELYMQEFLTNNSDYQWNEEYRIFVPINISYSSLDEKRFPEINYMSNHHNCHFIYNVDNIACYNYVYYGTNYDYCQNIEREYPFLKCLRTIVIIKNIGSPATNTKIKICPKNNENLNIINEIYDFEPVNYQLSDRYCYELKIDKFDENETLMYKIVQLFQLKNESKAINYKDLFLDVNINYEGRQVEYDVIRILTLTIKNCNCTNHTRISQK